MKLGRPSSNAQDLLARYLATDNDHLARECLAELVQTHAIPIIQGVIRKRNPGASNASGDPHFEMEDIAADARAVLLARLHAFRIGGDRAPISNWEAYVAAVAANVCAERRRRASPRRETLCNQVSYALTRAPGLAMWEVDRYRMVCGLAVWKEEDRRPILDSRLQALRDDPCSALPNVSHDLPLTSQMAQVLAFVGNPLDFNDLVDALASIRGVRDEAILTEAVLSAVEEPESRIEQIADHRADIHDEAAAREYLRALWDEVRGLPVLQRHALILHLDEIALLPASGIAGLLEIAATLGISLDELARLWNDLPLADRQIAQRLGLTVQQIINLRMAARKRLAGRMSRKGW